VVVTKTVGRRMRSAIPTQNTVIERATSTAMRRAATREKTKTVIEKAINISSGKLVSVIWARRNAYDEG